MKKILVSLIILICIAFILSSPKFGGKKTMGLDFWIGKYSYTECFPNDPEQPSNPNIPCIDYAVKIYKEEEEVYAEIINQGYQTNVHVLVKVIGDSQKIDLIFEKYLDINILNNYSKEDLLLSFQVYKNQLYTTWHKMKSEKAVQKKQDTGIYFERIN